MPETAPQGTPSNPIDTTVLKYDEPTIQAHLERAEARLEELWGSFPVVNTSPTWVPRTLRDQIAFDKARGRVYYYDFDNQMWRSTITEVADDASPVLSADLDANGNTVTGLATPSASTDAATKQYVDDAIPAVGGIFARLTSSGSFDSNSITTTETDILSYTMTGGTLGANDAIRYRLHLNWTLASLASPAATIRFKIGSSNVAQLDFAQGDTTSRSYKGMCEGVMQNLNSVSSQQGTGRGLLYVDGGGGTAPAQMIQHAQPTSSVNTASNHGVSATVQFSGSGRGTITVYQCEFELVRYIG